MTSSDPLAAIYGGSNAPPPVTVPPTNPPDPLAEIFGGSQGQKIPTGGVNQTVDPLGAIYRGEPVASTVQPKPEAPGLAGKAWQWLNTPLLEDLGIPDSRPGAGPIETGAEKFASGFTSPASLGLLAASFGGSAIEEGLTKLGLSAADAAATVIKGKLAANVGFLTKYGYDLGHNTKPQLEQYWGDYRAATNDQDKQKALDHLKEFATESTLNAMAAFLATKGIASDIHGIEANSPKGKALAQQQYSDAVYKFSELRRTASGQADQIEHTIEKEVPRADRQAAIYHNAEALGDPDVLEQRAVKAEQAGLPKLAAEVRDAKELSEREKIVRSQIQDVLTADGNDLKTQGALPPEAESAGYMPHKYTYEYLDPETNKPVPGLSGGEGFLKKRTYDSIVDAEIAGLAPIKNLAAVIADYHENAGYVMAKNDFAERMMAGRTNEGAPMAAPQGLRRGGVLGAQDALIDGDELKKLREAGTLESLIASGRIQQRLNPETSEPEYLWRQTDFEPSGMPYTTTGLNVWRDGQRLPLALNPDVAPHAQGLLEQANPSRVAKFALKVSAGAKSSLVALSPFHWATMANRMAELFKNPLQRPNVDWFNLTDQQQAALRDGLMIGGRNMGRAAEGLVPSKDSFVNKIPLVGGLNKLIEENLFGPSGYISDLKFDAYTTLKNEIQKSKPQMNDLQAGRIAATQVNNKFGGLNYDVLGRGANTQNALRLFMLAPDFLESSGRSILDVAGEHGAPLLKRLVAFNVGQWLLARGVNYLVSGDTHPESGFAVRSKDGKREYSIRTTLGDFLHFVEKPLDFAANRINPLGRAAAEDFYGVDEQGHKVTDTQKFFDTLRQITPIPVQGIYPNQQVSQAGAIDKFAQGMGVQSRKRFTPAETAAQEFASQREEGAPLEGDDLARAQLRYKLEDALRTTINARDNQGRIDALRQIHAASSGPDAKLSESDASEIIKTAHKFPTPLESTVSHLGLGDALQVWDKAGLMERRALRPIIQKRIENWQLAASKHTRKENDSMRQRIQAFRYSLGT